MTDPPGGSNYPQRVDTFPRILHPALKHLLMSPPIYPGLGRALRCAGLCILECHQRSLDSQHLVYLPQCGRLSGRNKRVQVLNWTVCSPDLCHRGSSDHKSFISAFEFLLVTNWIHLIVLLLIYEYFSYIEYCGVLIKGIY